MAPRQFLSLQLELDLLLPRQGLPLFAGAGFVQVRVFVWYPVPQVFEQVDSTPQADQPPAT